MSDRNLTFSTVSQCVIALAAFAVAVGGGVHYVSTAVSAAEAAANEIQSVELDVRELKKTQALIQEDVRELKAGINRLLEAQGLKTVK